MNFRERPTDIYNIYIYIYIKQSALIIIIILPVEPPSFVFASLFPSFLHCPPFRRLSKDTEILLSPPNSPLHNRFLEKGNTIDKRIQKKDLTDTCKSDRLNILPLSFSLSFHLFSSNDATRIRRWGLKSAGARKVDSGESERRIGCGNRWFNSCGGPGRGCFPGCVWSWIIEKLSDGKIGSGGWRPIVREN